MKSRETRRSISNKPLAGKRIVELCKWLETRFERALEPLSQCETARGESGEGERDSGISSVAAHRTFKYRAQAKLLLASTGFVAATFRAID